MLIALLLGLSWADLNRAASEAIKANDYARLKAVLLELRPLMPANSRVMYNLAVSHAKLSDTAAAEQDLIPESIVYESKRFLVSSVRKSKILTADGQLFAKTEWPAYGLAIECPAPPAVGVDRHRGGRVGAPCLRPCLR